MRRMTSQTVMIVTGQLSTVPWNIYRHGTSYLAGHVFFSSGFLTHSTFEESLAEKLRLRQLQKSSSQRGSSQHAGSGSKLYGNNAQVLEGRASKTFGGQKRKDVKKIRNGRRRRYRPGTRALMEIRKFQHETNLLIPALAFSRVVREVCDKVCTVYCVL